MHADMGLVPLVLEYNLEKDLGVAAVMVEAAVAVVEAVVVVVEVVVVGNA